MREVAQQEGWEKAGKLGDRPMSQGLVGVVEDSQGLTVLEVGRFVTLTWSSLF